MLLAHIMALKQLPTCLQWGPHGLQLAPNGVDLGAILIEQGRGTLSHVQRYVNVQTGSPSQPRGQPFPCYAVPGMIFFSPLNTQPNGSLSTTPLHGFAEGCTVLCTYTPQKRFQKSSVPTSGPRTICGASYTSRTRIPSRSEGSVSSLCACRHKSCRAGAGSQYNVQTDACIYHE